MVLDNFERGRIFGYVSNNPGVHFNKIKRSLGLLTGTAAYHLSMLEYHGLIKSEIDGQYRRYHRVPT